MPEENEHQQTEETSSGGFMDFLDEKLGADAGDQTQFSKPGRAPAEAKFEEKEEEKSPKETEQKTDITPEEVNELDDLLSLEEDASTTDESSNTDLSKFEEERKAWEEEKAKYEEKLAAFDVVHTPEYKEKVTEPMNRLWAATTQLAKSFETDPKQVAQAIAETDIRRQSELIDELTDGWPSRSKRVLDNMIDAYNSAQEARSALEEKAFELVKKYRSETSAFSATSKHSEQDLKEAEEKVFAALSKRIPLFKGDDGAKLAEEVRKAAGESDIFRTPQTVALAPYAVILLPKLLKANAELKQQLEGTKGTVEKLQSSTPGAGRESSDKGGDKPKEPTSFLDAVEAAFK